MQIREYRESDLAALRAIHAAQGFDYALPDLRNPLFLTKLVLTPDSEGLNVAPPFRAASGADSNAAGNSATETPASSREGNCSLPLQNAGFSDTDETPGAAPILGAALLRLTAEAYLLLDPRAGTPRQRWQWLLALQEAARRDAWQRGLEDVHAWLPPPIAQKFGRRLTQLGWLRDDAWTPYCKRL